MGVVHREINRMVMGAPVPEPEGQRVSPMTGLVIRDADGAERFGVGLFPRPPSPGRLSCWSPGLSIRPGSCAAYRR